VHPARFDDLARRKVIPRTILSALPSPAIYAKVKFASLAQIAKAKAKVNAEWASKTG
jgi:putative spermidine/putrescine transport system substrate-binding protein